MKVLLLILVSAGMIGCTKDQAKETLCSTGKAAASLMAVQVSVQLECKNVAAIQSDLEKKLTDLKVCSAPAPTPAPVSAMSMKAMSGVGSVVCKPLVDALFAGVLVQIPAAWECSGGKISEDAKTKLLEACSKAL